MRKLDDLVSRLRNFEEDLLESIKNVVQANAHIIEEMNSEYQLYLEGINRHGKKIHEYAPYSPITVQIKQMKGQPTTRVTLRDTGDFHYSFHLEFHSDGFEIKASDWKTEKLINQYGESILGLTDQNVKAFAEDFIAPLILKKLKSL